MSIQQTLIEFFSRTNDIARLTTQNGWPDPTSLRVAVVATESPYVICTVTFDEIAVEGAGCIAAHIPCWGKYRVRIGSNGTVEHYELLAGMRDE